uniref:DUF6535 domain-containing protein n=1 Tax=Moniliophthora roreri TaxID=221103 RepID=A0A0W0F4C5_MONRR
MALEGQTEFPSTTQRLKNQDPAQIPLPASPIPSHRHQISYDQNENSAGLPENKNPSPPATSQPADATGNGEERKKRPTVDESWEVLRRTVLVFAGLFSAVVTAFLIESYQWLSEDPADTTVALLIQLSAQLNAPQSIPAERPPFEADSFSIHINCLWFLSLILSLTTPGEELTLRQLRRESFEKWGVSSFLSALPILLEVALLLFFVGVLDLLWNRNRIPFAICFVTVMLSTGLYFVTTVLPTLTVPGDQGGKIVNWRFNELSYQFVCPYKSPQAWGVYYLSQKYLSFLSQRLWDHARSLSLVTDWSSFDLRVVRQFDRVPHPFTGSSAFNHVYKLRAFEWAVTMFRDSPSMIPHLQNVLGTTPTSVAMSAVLHGRRYTIWEDIPRAAVELKLRDPMAFYQSKLTSDPYTWDASELMNNNCLLHSPEGLSLLFCHHYWLAMARRPDIGSKHIWHLLYHSIDSNHTRLQQCTNLRFVIPFPVVNALWTHGDPKVSELLTSSRGQEFIQFIHEQVISRRVYETDDIQHQSLMSKWIKATQRAREFGNLPDDYFLPIPNQDPPPSLAHVADSSDIRYSIDSEYPPLNAEGENGGLGSNNNESGENNGDAGAAQEDTGGGIGGDGADERV